MRFRVFSLLLILIQVMQTLNAATEIRPGQIYQPGSELRVSSVGISFQVPKGWRAFIPQGGAELVLQSIKSEAKMMVSAVANSDDQSIRKFMSETQQVDASTSLQPSSQVILNQNLFQQSYQIVGDNPKNLVANAYGKLGRNQTALFLIMLEPKDQNLLASLGAQFLQAVEFTRPKNKASSKSDVGNDKKWIRFLRGRTLLFTSEKDGVTKKKYIDLCRNGKAHLRDRDIFFSEDATHQFSAANENKRSGRWKVDNNQLQLIWKDGPSTKYALSGNYNKQRTEWIMKLDNEHWQYSINKVCQ